MSCLHGNVYLDHVEVQRENNVTKALKFTIITEGIRFYSHVRLKSPFILPFKNGLNEFLSCSHRTLKYVKKIKGATDKNGALVNKA